MIATRDRAGNGAGGITAESVGHKPLASKQKLARHLRSVPRHRTDDGPDCFKLLVPHLSMSTARLVQPHFLRLGWRRGVFSRTSCKATVASAGNVQFSCVATVAVPDPPQRADSLDHKVSHS